MARKLDVYLHTDLVGHLTQDDDGDMSFRYAETWLQRAGAVPLSHSLPLRAERFRRAISALARATISSAGNAPVP